MKISFSFIICMLSLALIGGAISSSVIQMLPHTSRTQLVTGLRLARMIMDSIQDKIEAPLYRSTRAVRRAANGTRRIGNLFTAATPGEQESDRRRWLTMLSEVAEMTTATASVLLRFADNNAVYMATHLHGGIITAQLCESQFDEYEPNVTVDAVQNCSAIAYNTTTSQEIQRDVYNTSLAVAYHSNLWNRTLDTLKEQNYTARGVWMDDMKFVSTSVQEGFYFYFATMSFDLTTNEPIALVVGATFASDFSDILKLALPNRTESRAFLVDKHGSVISYSHGKAYNVTQLTGTSSDPPVTSNCRVTGSTMGCLYNISTYAPYYLMRLVHGARLTLLPPVAGSTDLIGLGVIIIPDSSDIYIVLIKRVESDFIGMSWVTYAFVPFDYFFPGIVDLNISTFVGVLVVSVVGGAVAFYIIRLSTSGVQELATKMTDPWRAKLPQHNSTSNSQSSDMNTPSVPESQQNSECQLIQGQGGTNHETADGSAKKGKCAKFMEAYGLSWLMNWTSQLEEVSQLEAMFAEFRQTINELRGFMLFPLPAGSRPRVPNGDAAADTEAHKTKRQRRIVRFAASTNSNEEKHLRPQRVAEPSGLTVAGAGTGVIGAIPASTAAAWSSSDFTHTSSGDDSGGPSHVSPLPAAPRGSARADTRFCFVAAVHVSPFNNAAAFFAPEQRAELIAISQTTVDLFTSMATSVGATMQEFHGDHFLFCVQIRKATKTKVPTLFALRLIDAANKLAERLDIIQQATLPVQVPASDDGSVAKTSFSNESSKTGSSSRELPCVLTAGFAVGSAHIVRLSATDEVVARPITFFGTPFPDALAIERFMRHHDARKLQLRLNNSDRTLSSVAGSGSVRGPQFGNNHNHMANMSNNSGGNSNNSNNNTNGFGSSGGSGGDGDDETERTTPVASGATAKVLAQMSSGVTSSSHNKSPKRSHQLSHAIGFDMQLQYMFEFVKCIAVGRLEIPGSTVGTVVTAKNRNNQTKGGYNLERFPSSTKSAPAAASSGRTSAGKAVTVMRILDVKRMPQQHHVLPVD